MCSARKGGRWWLCDMVAPAVLYARRQDCTGANLGRPAYVGGQDSGFHVLQQLDGPFSQVRERGGRETVGL